MLVCLFYLALHKHGHVHEHVVELLDGGLQLDDVGVPRLDVRQGLLGRSSVHDNALDIFHSESIGRVISSSANNMHCENSRIALFVFIISANNR